MTGTSAPALYIWRWRTKLPERRGTTCHVLARGTMNSALVEFCTDGVRHIVSRNALRKAP